MTEFGQYCEDCETYFQKSYLVCESCGAINKAKQRADEVKQQYINIFNEMRAKGVY